MFLAKAFTNIRFVANPRLTHHISNSRPSAPSPRPPSVTLPAVWVAAPLPPHPGGTPPHPVAPRGDTMNEIAGLLLFRAGRDWCAMS